MKKQEYHLKDSELATLDTNKNQQALLKHIRDCPFCSKRLAQILQKDILPAPHYLKQNILAKKQYLKRKKQEFTVYCIKIGLAVAACLAIIFLSNPTALINPYSFSIYNCIIMTILFYYSPI